jgi:serine/threonine-protein kinase
VSVALKQITEEPTPPSHLNPEISPELEKIILKGMSKSSKDRFASATEMKEALMELNGGEGLVTAAVSDKKNLRHKKLRPAGWAALAAGLILLMAVGYFAALGFFKVDEVEVPNVVNEEVEIAKEKLEESGLKVNVLSEIYDVEVPEGHVISQNPEGGEKVKKNRVVTLEVSKGAEIVEVPDVTGQSLREADAALNSSGFKVAADVNYIFDSQVGEGKVIQQFPKALTKEDQGAEVTLVVSKGPQPEYIKMPDLRGLSLEEAQKKLEEARLKLGNISNAESSFYYSGQVADQSVDPSSNILQGQSINVVVSKGPGPSAQFASVTVSVPDDGERHRIRIEVVDSKGTTKNTTICMNQVIESGKR